MSDLVVAHVNLARGFRGGERQTELLITYLSFLGVKQILLCRKGSVLVKHLEKVKDLEVIELSDRVDIRLSGHSLLRRRCNVLQVHEARAAQWALIHHAIYGVPYVITRRVPERIKNNFFNRMVYGGAARVVAIANSIAKYLKKEFNLDVEVIGDSSAKFKVNLEASNRLKRKYPTGFIVGNIGALVDKHKGQSTLIEAARIIKREVPNLKILFLGEGQDETELKKLAEDLIEQGVVHFEGFVENVGDYISIMNVFAYPSNYEGLGSVLLDVMLQGVPVVASRVDGIPDIVRHNDSGLLVEKGDAKGLARAILSIKQSKELTEVLVRGGQKIADEHSPEHIAQLYLNLYERLSCNK